MKLRRLPAAQVLPFFQFPLIKRPVEIIRGGGPTKAQQKHARQCMKRLALARRGAIQMVGQKSE